MRTLIVDDDITSSFFLQKLIEPFSTFVRVGNGIDALSTFRNAKIDGVPFDLIFLDIIMPDLDGQKVLQKIRTIEDEWKIQSGHGVKIIMLTSLKDRKTVLESFKNRCDAFLVKPLSRQKLEEALKQAGVHLPATASPPLSLYLADDDTTSLNMVSHLLKDDPYTLHTFSDGAALLEAFKKAPESAIFLLDWMMPHLNGLDVCQHLRNHYATIPLYIIMLTSKNESSEMVDALNAGADDFLSKPINTAVLKARIRAGMRILEMQRTLATYGHHMEQLAKERALQLTHADRMATLGLLTAGIAHEINNPNAFIAVNLQTLSTHWSSLMACLSGNPTEEEKEKAQFIAREMPSIFTEMREGVTRIREIVTGLKRYARLETGKKEWSSVHQLVDNALKLCANLLKKDILLEKTIQEKLPPFCVDTRQLEQVLVNLLVNAADALSQPTIIDKRIRLDIQSSSESLIITVSDSGPGLPVGYEKNLFKPFFTTKETGKGTGLGLAISHNIIEDHGGTITAKNGSLGGAEFCITLPLSYPSDDNTCHPRN